MVNFTAKFQREQANWQNIFTLLNSAAMDAFALKRELLDDN